MNAQRKSTIASCKSVEALMADLLEDAEEALEEAAFQRLSVDAILQEEERAEEEERRKKEGK